MARNTKQQTIPTQVRQGDVLVTRIDRVPAGLTPRPRDGGRVILAYGEVTGHAHAIARGSLLTAQGTWNTENPPAALYDDPSATDGSFVLRIEEATGLVHEEHARIDLAPGTYRVTRQREWTDADEPRAVAD